MSKQTNTLSRRNFLKGAVYTSALSMGGLSGVALASSVTPNQFIVTDTTSAAVTLMNQTAKPVALDATKPVSIEKINGWMVVKVNKASDTGSAQIMNLEAGQELSLSIDAELAPMMEINKQQTVMHRTIFVGNDNFPASLYHPTFA
jgi:hypothetical protein